MPWVSEANLNVTASATRFRINFIPGSSTCILALGGHIAMQATWGVGNSAVNINGSPYHMRLKDWNLGNLGNQDRSCNADAVANVGPCDFSGPSEVCAGTEVTYAIDLAIPPDTYQWSILDNSVGAYIVGSSTGTSIQVNTGSPTPGGTYTVQLKVMNAADGYLLTRTCEMVVLIDHTAPAISCPDNVRI